MVAREYEILLMVVSLPKPYYHTFDSYFWVFHMSTISRVFGQQLFFG